MLRLAVNYFLIRGVGYIYNFYIIYIVFFRTENSSEILFYNNLIAISTIFCVAAEAAIVNSNVFYEKVYDLFVNKKVLILIHFLFILSFIKTNLWTGLLFCILYSFANGILVKNTALSVSLRERVLLAASRIVSFVAIILMQFFAVEPVRIVYAAVLLPLFATGIFIFVLGKMDFTMQVRSPVKIASTVIVFNLINGIFLTNILNSDVNNFISRAYSFLFNNLYTTKFISLKVDYLKRYKNILVISIPPIVISSATYFFGDLNYLSFALTANFLCFLSYLAVKKYYI